MTLYEFLERSGARVCAYDLSRRIGALSRDAFLDFENALAPYPTPLQRKAWFALVQQSMATGDEPVIWFLCLDLDEQGLLVQAGRDYLLDRLLASVRAQADDQDPRALLHDNPYAFTPGEQRMAQFHALLRTDLGLPPSRFYAHALNYFRGLAGWDQWGFVGYQGIAEVACRHPAEPLAEALEALPREPLLALCHCLESQTLQPLLAAALLGRLRLALQDPRFDAVLVAALLRGLCGDPDANRKQAVVDEVLQHPGGGDIEILAAVAGRNWEVLLDEKVLHTYLQRLATNRHGQSAFEHSINDLLGLPAVSARLREALRSPQQTAEVAQAFARMLSGANAGQPQ